MRTNFFKLNKLLSILNPLSDIKLPIKNAYILNRINSDITKALSFYENKRQELLKRYTEVNTEHPDQIKSDEMGNAVFKSDADKAKFLEEIDKVQGTEIEIKIAHLLPINELGDISLSANEVILLQGVVDGIEEVEDIIDVTNLDAVTQPEPVVALEVKEVVKEELKLDPHTVNETTEQQEVHNTETN